MAHWRRPQPPSPRRIVSHPSFPNVCRMATNNPIAQAASPATCLALSARTSPPDTANLPKHPTLTSINPLPLSRNQLQQPTQPPPVTAKAKPPSASMSCRTENVFSPDSTCRQPSAPTLTQSSRQFSVGTRAKSPVCRHSRAPTLLRMKLVSLLLWIGGRLRSGCRMDCYLCRTRRIGPLRCFQLMLLIGWMGS
jgi:hypothetical protein